MSNTLERAAHTLTWYNLASRWHIEHGSDFAYVAGAGWQDEDGELCDSEDAFRAMSDDMPLDVWETWYAHGMRATLTVGQDGRDPHILNVVVDLADDVVAIFNGANVILAGPHGEGTLDVEDEMGIGRELIWRFYNTMPTN